MHDLAQSLSSFQVTMRRHTPSLYPHPEQATEVSDGDEEWEVQSTISSRSHLFNAPSSSRTRLKSWPKNLFPLGSQSAGNGSMHASSPQLSRYSDIYSQFVRRYRS